MSSRRNKSIFWVIVGLVVVVFLYLASAGHLTFGENFEEEKEPEPPADEEPEQVTPVTRTRGAESLTPEAETKSLEAKRAIVSTVEFESTQQEDLESMREELKCMEKEKRTLDFWAGLIFFIVRLIFVLLFAVFNLFFFFQLDLTLTFEDIVKLVPYNNAALILIGIILFMIFKSPSNIRSLVRAAKRFIDRTIYRKNKGLGDRIRDMKTKLDCLNEPSRQTAG